MKVSVEEIKNLDETRKIFNGQISVQHTDQLFKNVYQLLAELETVTTELKTVREENGTVRKQAFDEAAKAAKSEFSDHFYWAYVGDKIAAAIQRKGEK